MKNQLLGRLAVALVLSVALPAAAQTGRIAHYSHGGSAATLAAAEEKDNFGLWEEYKYTKVTRLNDSTVLVEGQKRWPGQSWNPVRQLHEVHLPASPIEAINQLRKKYPDATFRGFENTDLDKVKSRRKKAGGISIGTPSLPGGGLSILLLLVLTGAGWLMAGKFRPALSSCT